MIPDVSKHQRLPILEALQSYRAEGAISFHVPGHKHGEAAPELVKAWGKQLFEHDLTIMPDLDSIYKPRGVIAEAQRLAADAFGSEHAFFLVNGTTSAIQGMLLASLTPGDRIILPRNIHKAVLGGLILAGAEPIYTQPPVHDYLGVVMGMTAAEVESSLKRYPEARAVFVINTTYYGMAPELAEICRVASSYDVPVLVDEAHGAHLRFHPDLPPAAMETGCDIAASSTHKLAGSLTQSSMLLLKSERLTPQRVKRALNLTQTTSPSYPLLASLDAARQEMVLRGRERLSQAIELACWARQEINNIPGFYVYGDELVGQIGCPAFDPTKLVINGRGLGLSGFRLERLLRQEHHIQVELSDLFNILCIVSLGDSQDTVGALVSALQSIAAKHRLAEVDEEPICLPPIPELAYLPQEAYYSETRLVPLRDAVGKIIAEVVMAYPPGIPLIAPGEIVTQEVIDYVYTLKEQEAHICGTDDPTAEFVKVVR